MKLQKMTRPMHIKALGHTITQAEKLLTTRFQNAKRFLTFFSGKKSSLRTRTGTVQKSARYSFATDSLRPVPTDQQLIYLFYMLIIESGYQENLSSTKL